jgi:serine/threonine protein kinase
MARPGDRLGDRYALIEVIGSDWLRVVWRARDTRLGRTVAVEILRPQFARDPEFLTRLEGVARHAAHLAHPNIAAVHGLGFDRGPDGSPPYIVMELVDGPSIAELLRGGRLPPTLAIDVAIAAARALAAAHRRRIVHGHVKPANLLVGLDGPIRLADFEIAPALLSSHSKKAGIILRSSPYTSPEQARGEEALPTSDIFSLGVVLFQMLNGRLPEDRDAAAVIRGSALPGADHREAPGLPAGLDAIVARALEPDP